jgi:hypothetical protein
MAAALANDGHADRADPLLVALRGAEKMNLA